MSWLKDGLEKAKRGASIVVPLLLFSILFVYSLFNPVVYGWTLDNAGSRFYQAAAFLIALTLFFKSFKPTWVLLGKSGIFRLLFLGIICVGAFVTSTFAVFLNLLSIIVLAMLVSGYKESRLLLMALCILGNIVELTVCLLKYAHWIPSAGNPFGGTFDNVDITSIFLTACIPLTVYTVGYFRRSRFTYLSILPLFLCLQDLVIIIGVNRTRSCILAICIAFIIFCLARLKKRWVNWGASVVVVSIAVATCFILKPDSTRGRLLILKIVLQNLHKVPVLGLGYGKFQVSYLDWQNAYFRAAPGFHSDWMLADALKYAFNDYLEFYCEFGLIACLLLMIVLLRSLARRKKEPFEIATDCGLTVLSITSFFSYNFHCIPLVILFALFVKLSDPSEGPACIKGGRVVARALTSLGCMLSVLLLAFYTKVHSSEESWLKAGKLSPRANRDNNYLFYRSALPTLKDNGEFLYDFAATAISSHDLPLAIDLLEQSKRVMNVPEIYNSLGYCYTQEKEYALAEKDLNYSVCAVPNRLIPRDLLMELFLAKGDTARGLQEAQEIIALPVKVPSAYTDYVRMNAHRLLDSALPEN